MPMETASVLGLIAALVGTILLYVFIMPRRMNGNFANPFLQFLHDLFHFKQLFIETIMKFIYTLLTMYCIGSGFFMLFVMAGNESLALTGLLTMILGPIFIRIIYEFLMMSILLVQNVLEINKKLGKAPKDAAPAKKDPYAMPYDTGYNGTTTAYNGANAYGGNAYGGNAYGGNAYSGNAAGGNAYGSNAYGSNAAGNGNYNSNNAAGSSKPAGNGNYNGSYGNYQGGSQY